MRHLALARNLAVSRRSRNEIAVTSRPREPFGISAPEAILVNEVKFLLQRHRRRQIFFSRLERFAERSFGFEPGKPDQIALGTALFFISADSPDCLRRRFSGSRLSLGKSTSARLNSTKPV